MVPWIKKVSVCAVRLSHDSLNLFSDHEKLQYDRKLRQAQRKALEVEKVTTTDASNLSAKKEIPFEPVAVTQTKESPLKNYLFAAFAFCGFY